MKNMKKTLVLALAVLMVVGLVIGGSLAWLTDKTRTVENTFTVGNIDIELKENDSPDDEDQDADKNDYKMIPGWTITKDPVATVKADSEDCYLFVKLDKSTNFDDFMEYEIADGWTELTADKDGNPLNGVYYREVETGAADQSFDVIKGHTVTVKDTVKKEDMDALDDRTEYPTLNVTAYAVQLYKTNKTEADAKFTPAEAWAIANS